MGKSNKKKSSSDPLGPRKKFQLPLPHRTMGPCVNNDAMDTHGETADHSPCLPVCVWAALGSVVKCFLKKKSKMGEEEYKRKRGGGDGWNGRRNNCWNGWPVPVVGRKVKKKNPGRFSCRDAKRVERLDTKYLWLGTSQRLCYRGGGARNFNNEWPPPPPAGLERERKAIRDLIDSSRALPQNRRGHFCLRYQWTPPIPPYHPTDRSLYMKYIYIL